MNPRTVVQPTAGDRAGQAGVVESVSKEKDADGVPLTVTVKMDIDGKLETFKASELKVLVPH